MTPVLASLVSFVLLVGSAQESNPAGDAKDKIIRQQERELLEYKQVVRELQDKLKVAETRVAATQAEALALQVALAQALREATAGKLECAVLQQRLARLELALAEKTRELALARQGIAIDPKQPPKDVPPAGGVRGKVIKVDMQDPTLLILDIGADQGVMLNQMLELYRLTPQPKYLGVARVVEVTPRQTIARFRVTAGAAQPTVGDEVASGLRDK